MPIKSASITPEKVYRQRRKLIIAGAAALAIPGINYVVAKSTAARDDLALAELPVPSAEPEAPNASLKPTKLDIINSYNNYYEFGFSKEAPSRAAKTLVTSPWSIEIGGEGADNPMLYDIADIHKEHDIENRVYRFRCVEAWSMVIPWNGIPLSKIIAAGKPNSKAKYVRFQTVNRPSQMPNADWAGGPYIEGLTMAEAVHPLALMSTGIYDKPLEQQTGAPIRLVLPWKYGFKYAKSIIKIDLVEKMPRNTWWAQNSREYGFYANVNPNFNHPRWSQASERVIGTFGRQDTLLYNGYAEEVGHLYPDVNDRRYFF